MLETTATVDFSPRAHYAWRGHKRERTGCRDVQLMAVGNNKPKPPLGVLTTYLKKVHVLSKATF